VYVRLGRLQARTDCAGRFVIGEVPPGPQRLTLRIGLADLYLAKFDVPPHGDVHREFRLTGTGAVVGRFTSAKVESVTTAHVSLRRKPDGELVAQASFGIGGDGSFRFPYLDPGDYDLVGAVMRRGSVKRAVTVANDTVDVGDLAIEPTPEVPVVATVPAGVKVAGEVQVRGKGLEGDAYGWIALGDDGRGFLRGLKPGRYRLGFTAPGCAPLEVDVEIEAEPSQPLAFTLLPR
jgi:hypothetical protein